MNFQNMKILSDCLFGVGLNLNNGVSPMMEVFDFFHDKALYVFFFISFFMGISMFVLLKNRSFYLDNLENKNLEMVWTMLPGVMLLFLALPSLNVLYYMDFPLKMEPGFSVKVLGHQWYWSYYYNSGLMFKNPTSYDSFIDVSGMDKWNYEVNRPVLFPFGTLVRVLVSSSDVIHSFAIPQFGVKLDCMPGRLNQFFSFPSQYGVYYGQCSEICGVNHSFMPMRLEVVRV